MSSSSHSHSQIGKEIHQEKASSTVYGKEIDQEKVSSTEYGKKEIDQEKVSSSEYWIEIIDQEKPSRTGKEIDQEKGEYLEEIFDQEKANNRDQNLKKGPWTKEEDEILAGYVRRNGEGNWNAVQKKTGLVRCGKSCRLRWSNHLRPDLKKGPFSKEEENKIIRFHAKWGNKWARIALELPGRTDNEIKNYWNTRIKKMQRVGLPIYPSDIEVLNENHEIESDSNQQGEENETRTNQFDVPELVFRNYKHNGNLPPYESSMFNFDSSSSFSFPTLLPQQQLHSVAPTLTTNYEYGSSSGPSSEFGAMELPDQGSIWDTPSSPMIIPSVDDYLVDPEQQNDPPITHHNNQSREAYRNGYLESIFYSLKDLDEKIPDETELANLDALLPHPNPPHQSAFDDTLYSIILGKGFK